MEGSSEETLLRDVKEYRYFFYINIVTLKSARMVMNKMLLGYCILLLETVPRRLSNFPTLRGASLKRLNTVIRK